jgi:hypothetical protein
MIFNCPVLGSLKNSGAQVLTGVIVEEAVEMVATSFQVWRSVLLWKYVRRRVLEFNL